jgi:subtilisin family serine protease
MHDVHGTIRDELAALGYAEVVVFLRPPTPPPSAAARLLAGAAAPPAGPGPLAAPSLPEPIRRSFLSSLPHGQRGACVRHFPRLGVIIGFADPDGVAELASDPEIALLTPAPVPSLIRPVRRAPARARAAATTAWGLAAVKAPSLWEAGIRGAGVRIGQLDTGVDGRHPALRRRIAAWAEFDLEGEPVAESQPHDPDGHGTHTAGTLVGGRSAGTAVGVAPEAELCAGLVIEGGRVLLRVVAGLEWAIGQGARIISISLGIRGYTPFAIELFRRLRENGVLPVAAIGNEGPGTSRSPGNYVEALSVGAVDREAKVPDFSSSMRFEREVEPTAPDVVAPGVDITSLRAGGGLEVMDGTSMATPHVAGLAALLFSARPESTVSEIENAIVMSAERLPAEEPVRGGRGAVDGAAAYAFLTGGSPADLAPRRPAGHRGRGESARAQRGSRRRETAHG